MNRKPSDEFLERLKLKDGQLHLYKMSYWYPLRPQARYTIDGRQVSAARLHWYLHHGVWPDHKIYFEDGDTMNFSKENMQGVRLPSKGRTKPYQAVCRDSTGKARHLGYFMTQDERDAAMQTFKQMRASGLV